MTVTVPQRLARDTATIAAATRVRWTYIAPTLLVFWIVSMFDKSNIALVIADPKSSTSCNLSASPNCLAGWWAVCSSPTAWPHRSGAGR